MTYQEFQDILSSLDYASYKLEQTYAENEGEVTEETELMEAEVSAMRTLLNTEGVDFLGRWLKGKEDKKKTLKAEKDYLTRQIEAVDNTISFIKAKIHEVMEATGCEKVKGSLGYCFATTVSTTTSVDKDILRDHYQSLVEEAVKDILPADVTVTLGASVSKLEEGSELPDYYHQTVTPTVRFTKPRGAKE